MDLIIKPGFDISNPFFNRNIRGLDLPTQFTSICMRNLGIASKYILNRELFPFQQYILTSVWDTPFPVLVASRGFGKCISGNSYITTSNGFCRMEDLFNKECLLETKYPCDFDILGEKGFNTPEYMWKNRILNTKKIITEFGYDLEAVFEHKIRVVRNGEITWVKSEDLIKGDYVVIGRGGK